MPHAVIPEAVLVRLARAQRVSEGELKALRLALEQRKSKDIAQALGISEAATRKRLGEVYRKFGIKGRGPGKLASLKQRLAEAVSEGPNPERESLDVKLPKRSISHLRSHVSPSLQTQYYWNDAPALNLFQGRREDLIFLHQWLTQPVGAHKLLAICGIGGIGKTVLARKLAEELAGHYAQVVWLTARERQTPFELLQVLLKTLSASDKSAPDKLASYKSADDEGKGGADATVQSLIDRLMICFSQRPCLVIIDGFEAVFKSCSDSHTGRCIEDSHNHSISKTASGARTPTFHSSRQQQASLYREDLKAYEQLFDALRQSLPTMASGGTSIFGQQHLDRSARKPISRSSLILTSREKPRELLSIPEGDRRSHLYTLDGLKDHEAANMLSQFRLRGDPADYRALVARYYGHPMALRLAANAVKDMFYGRIRDFLEQEISVFDDLRSVLKTQFKRLSPDEIEVMYWLAINHVPCRLEDLQADVVSQDLKQNLLYALQSLERRFLVEVKPLTSADGVSFELHPIVAEYVLTHFIREIFQDLMYGDLSLFNRHSLMKADAEESCRQFQKELIVQPILERLRNYLKSLAQVDEYLNQKLATFREGNAYRLGYAGGNFVNLMLVLSRGRLSHKDFSKLTIWQAYLQGAQLREVKFTRCELDRSVFTETVSDCLVIAFNDVSSHDANLQSCRPVAMRSPLLACGDTQGMVHIWLASAAMPTDSSLAPLGTAARGGLSAASAGQKCAEWSAHTGWVRSLAFFRHRACLLTGADDSTLRLWQLPTFTQQSLDSQAFNRQSVGQPRLLWSRPTSDRVHSIALSPDETIAAVGSENRIEFYATESGQKLGQLSHRAETGSNPKQSLPAPDAWSDASATNLLLATPLTQRSSVRSLAFSSDGQWLASCGDDNMVRLWSVDALKHQWPDALARQSTRASSRKVDSNGLLPIEPSAEFSAHTDWVRTLTFSADGQWLLSGSDDGTVRIWPVCRPVRRPLRSGSGLDQARFSQGKNRGNADYPKVLRNSTDRIRSIAVSDDGRLLAVGGDDCQVSLWDLATQQQLDTMSTHSRRIWSVAFQRQGNRLLLAAGGDKQAIMLWQVHVRESEAALSVTTRPIKTYRGYTDGIRAVQFVGANHIVSGGDSRELSIWGREKGDHKATFSLHQGRIWAIAVDAQNARIASASDDHTIKLWNAHTGQCLTTFAEHTSWVRTVAFSQRGRFLASSGDDGTIRIWNTTSSFCLKALTHSTHWIHSVCFDPRNSRYLVSGGDDKTVRCWDRKEGYSRPLATHDQRICSVAYSPCGQLVASGSEDNTVILWDVNEGKILYRLTAAELGIKSVAFSADGRYLAAGGDDQLVYLWEIGRQGKASSDNCLASSSEPVCFQLGFQSYAGATGGIRSVAFSPDSRFVICGGLDATVRIGDLRLLPDFSPDRGGRSPMSTSLPLLTPLIQPERPYENTEIEGVKGLSHLQVSTLLSLGAVGKQTSLHL